MNTWRAEHCSTLVIHSSIKLFSVAKKNKEGFSKSFFSVLFCKLLYCTVRYITVLNCTVHYCAAHYWTDHLPIYSWLRQDCVDDLYTSSATLRDGRTVYHSAVLYSTQCTLQTWRVRTHQRELFIGPCKIQLAGDEWLFLLIITWQWTRSLSAGVFTKSNFWTFCKSAQTGEFH